MLHGVNIHYASHKYISQLYSQTGDNPGEITETTAAATRGGLELSLLAQIISILNSSLKFTGGAEVIKTKTTKHGQISESEQEINMLSRISEKALILPANISDVNLHHIYKHPLTAQMHYMEIKGAPSVQVKITQTLGDYELRGLTSYDNWVAKSMINSLLYMSASQDVEMESLLIPQAKKDERGGNILHVRFLLIWEGVNNG